MYKNVLVSNVNGKIIKGLIYSLCDTRILISFTDETFTIIEATQQSWGDIEIVPGDFDVFDFSKSDIVMSGVFTEKEYEEALDSHREKEKQRQEETEYESYQRLKEKFGD